MVRSFSRIATAAALSAAMAAVGAGPAAAQFFNPLEALFGPPPRPPSSVPRQQAPQPQAYPSPYQDQPYPASPGQTIVPRQGTPGIQSQPLPPPAGGTASADPNAPVGPGQRPRGTQQPADTSPQPGDEVITETPSQKVENKSALFTGLDKITGRIINFDVALGETVQFGALQVTPRACYTRPPTESPNTDAFLEVDEVTLQGEVKRIFTGWMYAASPGLHAVEHPIYDIWLTDCKNPMIAAAIPVVDATATPPAQPAKPTPSPRRSNTPSSRQPIPPR